MSRSVSEIYNSILEEKAKYQSLESLNSTSNAAIWRSIYYVTAVAIATAEQLRDVFQTEMLETAATLPTGIPNWYAAQTLLYQEGYALTYDRETGKVGYETLDEEAQIVEVATCESENTNVVIKVAKSDGTDGLEELTSTELISVTNYVNQIKFAGTVTTVLSLPADLLKLEANISIDPTIINSLGQSVADTSIYPVEDAINDFIKSYGLLNFDSTFKLVELTDAIQQTSGVSNVAITTAEAKASGGTTYLDIFATELNTYKAASGYLAIDSAFPLIDGLTYIIQ